MLKTLILYSTVDGQTQEICKRISDTLKKTGDAEIFNISEASKIQLSQYDGFILGASIRYGKHRSDIFNFIKKNQKTINIKKNAFFSVNVVARKPEKNSPETNPYMQKFIELSAWQPELLAVFGGKIDYPKYGFIDKFMIRLIMWITKGPTNTSGTFEFTDWDKVDHFAQKFNQRLEN